MSSAIVVGSGIFGGSVAHELVERGWEVTLVDRYPPGHVRAASGGESRLIRCSHGSAAWYTRSARRALELWRELERHAAEEVPNEACGLVLLRDGRAVGYERGRNVEASPYRFRLEVEPEVWFLEDEGYELAVFHSHPTSAPRPSRTDLERAGLWASRPWLILRTDTRELAAWCIDDGRARELTIA